MDAAGELRLGGHAVSLVYSRFDFSHPFGTHQVMVGLGLGLGLGLVFSHPFGTHQAQAEPEDGARLRARDSPG